MIETLEKILNKANIDYNNTGSRIYFACPFHNSTSHDSLSVLIEGKSGRPVWRCWSQNCQNKYGFGIYQLCVALCKLYNIDIDIKDEPISNTVGYVRSALVESYQEKLLVEKARYNLEPSKYFETRFSPSLLKEFYVGYCSDKTKFMYERSVVPVFNDVYTHIVGCIGRTIYDKCDKCSKYHNQKQKCPITSFDKIKASKWINSPKFDTRYYLYNWWNAKNAILENGSVFLVEGPPDTWRLYEAGIKNVVGLFGTSLKEEQLQKLNSLPISTIYIALNSDEAGNNGSSEIIKQCKRYYNLERICPTQNDWADHTVEDIRHICKR